MDLPSRVQAVVGAGRGALVEAMFGAGWLGWGLGKAKAFNGFTGPTFGFMTLLLLACSVYVLRRGRLLRKEFPVVDVTTQRTIRKRFLLVALLEFLLIAVASILAEWLHRPDLATVWCAMIVGLHFLPLAKILRAPNLGILGVLMTLWGLLCWVLLRSDPLVVSASLGTGILLWGSCVWVLIRARGLAHSLRSAV
jgi:hypothetical protein